jgi:site-specific recombinase XerD
MNNKNNASNPSVSCDVLESHIDAFIAELKTAGYATKTLNDKRRVLRHFISWQRCQKHSTARLNESDIRDFLGRSQQHGKNRRRLESAAITSFLEYLRRHSVIQTFTPNAVDTVSSMLEKRYADFLRNEKGLAELSLKVYLPVAKDLLHYLEEEHAIRSVRRLDASLLRAFLFKRAQARSSECVRLLATSLRSFLRFLHAQDEIPNDLTAAIPTVRRWTQPDVPKKLTTTEVKKVLQAPDSKTATGRRDYAILLLLARLGLRSSEILSIELDDLRWRAGEIVIRGKGNRQDMLPLPRDVGAAIASYLRRDRDARGTRRVFLRTIAPRVPMTGPASIGGIVRRAMVKAGVDRPMQIAAHLFRHTLASKMLQHGANLREISEVLRHQSITSTEIYAKIDMNTLQEVVQPWPAQGGVR